MFAATRPARNLGLEAARPRSSRAMRPYCASTMRVASEPTGVPAPPTLTPTRRPGQSAVKRESTMAAGTLLMACESSAPGRKAPPARSMSPAKTSCTAGTRARLPEKTKNAAKVTTRPQSVRTRRAGRPNSTHTSVTAAQAHTGSTCTTASTQPASAASEHAASRPCTGVAGTHESASRPPQGAVRVPDRRAPSGSSSTSTST